MKYLNFSIAETSGRTFEIPMDKVEELIKEAQKEAEEYGDTLEVDLNDDYEVSRILTDWCFDNIAEFETANDYLEITLADSKMYEA